MCLKENYSDSPSNEYSRQYSAKSEYLRRQNMNSKLGEEQKKGHYVRSSPNFDSNSVKKQKKGQNDNGLILGRVSINTRTRPSPSNALLLGRVRVMPYYSAEYSDSTRHIPTPNHHRYQPHWNWFLDVTLNLHSGKYWPYRKPNNHPLYIHSQSNHSPCIERQLLAMVERRIFNIACNQKEFNKAAPIYSNALASSDFSGAINFNAIDNKMKLRKRKILWFNPPFSEHVTTNIGRSVLKFLDKHFPPRTQAEKNV